MKQKYATAIQMIKKLIYWVFILFLVYIIFELGRKIFGGSLGFEELVIGLLIANLGYSFYLKESIQHLDSKLSQHLGWHSGRKGTESFK